MILRGVVSVPPADGGSAAILASCDKRLCRLSQPPASKRSFEAAGGTRKLY